MRVRLTSKYTLVISLVLLGGLAVFSLFSIRTVEDVCMEDALREVETLSEAIIRTTHYQMLEDDRKRVYQMINELASQKDVELIRLFNKEGLITFSTSGKEIGHRMDALAEGCYGCHRGEVPLTHAPAANRSRTFVKPDGRMVLGVTKEIPNQYSCYAASCHFHSADAAFLGVLDVHVSLESMRARMGAYQNEVIVFTLGMLLVISACLGVLTKYLVNRPVNQLLAHTRNLAQGDWNSVIDYAHQDELGELSDAFNRLTLQLRQAREELEGWGHNLEAKVEERAREIQQIQAQLVRSEKLASLGELVAGIAHEINNPLTGILVYASMLIRDPRLHPDLRRDLDVIIQETGNCAKIVRGLLDFSRESTPRKERSSLNGIMEKALSLLRHQPLFQNIEIVEAYDPALPEVLLDPGQIEQVFINLLVNAAQAMEEGGRLEVGTDTAQEGTSARVRVADTGCGIAPENLERVFDPFFSTKESRGTGLGLSVSYGIIENHGGRIGVESTPGKGTVFTVLLPIEAEQSAPPSC